jgi:hypothetical protein
MRRLSRRFRRHEGDDEQQGTSHRDSPFSVNANVDSGSEPPAAPFGQREAKKSYWGLKNVKERKNIYYTSFSFCQFTRHA